MSYYYGIEKFRQDCLYLADLIRNSEKRYSAIHGIPQGGTAPALELGRLLDLPVVEESQLNNWQAERVLIVDDLVDSGATLSSYKGHDTAVIHVKNRAPQEVYPTFYATKIADDWITYWWEAQKEKSIRDNVIRILQFIGEDPTRSGLIETPDRVVRSWSELFVGYQQDPADVFKVFDEEGYNELVWMKDIEFYSMCEHHMLGFYGKAHVGYIANNEKVIGASKLARLVDIFARRLSTQERIARQVVNSLMTYLQPKAAGCIIDGIHLCMRCRGVSKQNSIMGTSCMQGLFLDNTDDGRAARAEFIALVCR